MGFCALKCNDSGVMARTLAIIALVALGVVLSLLRSRPAALAEPMLPTGPGQPAFVFEAARAGDLDRAFGVGGKVITDLGQIEGIEDLAVQADGKIVAVGTTWNRITNANHFVVVRYTSRGSLDAGFGAGRAGDDAANVIVVDGDGLGILSGVRGR